MMINKYFVIVITIANIHLLTYIYFNVCVILYLFLRDINHVIVVYLPKFWL